MKLYWCWTADHHEDWFVIARSGFHARRLHRDAFGYPKGTVQCERVCKLPKTVGARAGHAESPVLADCGAQFVSIGARKRPQKTVVRLNGRIYMQGSVLSQLI